MKPFEPSEEPLSSTAEPLRLRDGGGSELDRRLLGSARLDSAPSAARARLAAALGVPVNGAAGATSVTPGALPGAAAPSAAGLFRASSIRVAGLGAASIVGGVIAWRALVPAPVEDAPVVAAPVSVPA